MNLRLAATMAACAALVMCGGKALHAQVEPQGYPPQQAPAGPQSGGPGPQPQPLQQFVPQGPPPPPFVLLPEEQAALDKVLAAWEKQSSQLKTFRCDFTHFVYDATFVPPGNPNGPRSRSEGKLDYEAPDKGSFREEKVTTWQFKPSTRTLEPVTLDHGEHWACDGKSIFQVDHVKREVHETKLPPEMQGQSITEGPLPFAFGAQAAKLKSRYFIRISTPPNSPEQVWLDIRPKLQKDVVNYIGVEVILHTGDMLPEAIKIRRNRNDSDVYTFEKQGFITQIAGQLDWSIFTPKPFGYKVIAEKPPGESGPPAPGNNQPPAGNTQARRPNPQYGPGDR